MRGDVNGFLTGGSIQHEENFLRLYQVTQAHEFLHERLVNLQTASRIKNNDVAIIELCKIQRLAGDFQNVRLAAFDENGNFNLLGQRFQLIHRRRTIHLRRDEQRRATLFFQQLGEFSRRSGFARAVQTNHHQASRIAGQI